MLYKNLKSGVTLLETIIAMGFTVIIGGALITMALTAMSAQQSSNLRNLATRCAEAKIEEIKNTERVNRSALQSLPVANWNSIFPNSQTDNCPYNTGANFFTRTTTFSNITNGKEASVVVNWTEKGRATSLTLKTHITKWL
ncbi:hypothetical protein A2872_01290 [Candidatus Gottesmanbacteria bacterium RIFCSPHIGHO2_01_FULL_42_12]|uniref:Type IV pilus modification protein PilV n=1 Tax=Candidatus Gottesmanbacteria bacterium RIFCSPHIGHO2_01_FULL_42_12 TaxID=1798377 RepID=A0A1F5Z1W8_9BACT|nr:MAG: hypothetical protein A2872_01290 [Candidatus Gottesmanbacteria bacterium RIFCSPHIGHO2_01_FULL_42_12]